MGNKSSTYINSIVTEFAAQAILRSTSLSRTQASASQIVIQRCSAKPELDEALANSIGCRSCLEANPTNPTSCLGFCRACVIGNISQTLLFTFTSTRQQSINIANTFAAALTNTIDAYTKNRDDAISQFFKAVRPGDDDTWVQNNIVNKIAPVVDVNVVQECTDAVVAQQLVDSSGTGQVTWGITQNMTISVISNTLQQNSTVNSATLEVADAIKQRLENDNSTVAQLGDVFSNLTNLALIAGAIVVIIFIMYMLMGRGKGGGAGSAGGGSMMVVQQPAVAI